MNEKFWHLKNSDLFGQLESRELELLETRSRARKFAARAPICLPVDHRDHVFLLAKGRAKICHLTGEGKQSILTFVEPGELFGELALLEPADHDDYVEALEASTVVMIPGAEVQRLMTTYPEVTLGVTKLIGVRRKRIERRLKQLLFLSNRERLTHVLLELVEQYGRHTEEGVELAIRLSHQDLANIIGSTRESVTVMLGKLQAEGLVRVRRQRLALLQLRTLANTVGRAVPQIAVPDRLPASNQRFLPQPGY